jgi:hypothetical protein
MCVFAHAPAAAARPMDVSFTAAAQPIRSTTAAHAVQHKRASTMKDLNYTDIPAVSKWHHDSSVTFAVRKHDIALTRIDELLEDYQSALTAKSVGKKGLILCDLFLTLEYWFKMHEKYPGKFEDGRVPAMRALLVVVLNKLGPFFADRDGVIPTRGQILAELKKYFGAGMADHGYKADKNFGMVTFDKKVMYKYRVWFKQGLAYQTPWWVKGHGSGKVLANSRHGYVAIVRPGGGAEQMDGWSGFVMMMDRQIFMTKHDFDASRNKNNNFHSSYNGGDRVAMAGTICIKDGRITGVRTDSGHYQPGLHNMNAFLWALKMYQVTLKGISLYNEKGTLVADAEAFYSSGRTWEQFDDGGKLEQKKLDKAKAHREAHLAKMLAPA